MGKLQVLVKNELKRVDVPEKWNEKHNDITVYRKVIKEEIKEEKNKETGEVKTIKTIKESYEPINLTRKINETAKIIKEDNAEEKIKQLQEILGKKE